ncbi:hypothetical protein [Pseudolactococcus insecticola]|uniref:Uncharacterized protein n=1 Tax=Pseudolactococcus insecticola TaxID=2709158 RepID=A0A6A0B7X4_9LACT|nr:hypothetical protein [Lactococcus insecticola]GFH41392.1 hypothetical protein Hs20B_17900 [Lactococcus insecticola]
MLNENGKESTKSNQSNNFTKLGKPFKANYQKIEIVTINGEPRVRQLSTGKIMRK